jgi:predicted Zn-dependent protease
VAHFSNPPLPEDVNNSDDKPLRCFIALVATLLLIGALAVGALALAGGLVARHVPYAAEAELADAFAAHQPAQHGPVSDYLQSLADRLSPGMALPEGMRIRIRYEDAPVVNAFATLGGHVIVYRGLLERLPDENTLAMVLAHEIAHAKYRHPAASLGRGVAVALALTAVSSIAGSGAADYALGSSGLLTALSFSRTQESEADGAALGALVRLYGHTGGASDTFAVLERAARENGHAEPPAFFATHPGTAERIAALSAQAAASGWAADGQRTVMPDAVKKLLARSR